MTEQSRVKSLAEYQKSLSIFENTNDFSIIPGLFLIVRLDAHRVSGLNSKSYPLDKEFFNVLTDTARRLLLGPIFSVCSYVHGDEISLLLSIQESSNPRKRSKLLSTISSYATLFANQRLSEDDKITFHTKLSEIPDVHTVADYFIWQRFVAVRNSVNYFLINSAENNKSQSKELVSTVSSLSLFDRTKYLEDLGVKYWEKEKFVHSGEFLYKIDNSSRELSDAFKTFDSFNGPSGLDVEDYLDDFLEILYSSLQISGTSLLDEKLYKLPATEPNNTEPNKKSHSKPQKPKLTPKPKGPKKEGAAKEPSKNTTSEVSAKPKKVPFRIGAGRKSKPKKSN